MPCARSGRQKALSTTTTFSTFSLHLDLSLSTQRLQPRTRSVYLTSTNGTSSLTYPSQPFILSFLRLFPFQPLIISFLRLSHLFLRPRMGLQFGRFQSEIAFLWGRRKLLKPPTSWTSDDDSALAFHGSIFNPRGEAIKLFILNAMASRRRPRSMTASRASLFFLNRSRITVPLST